jgi:hypothetical protein
MMTTTTPFRPRTVPEERQIISETIIGRYRYTVTLSHGRYYVTCADTASNQQQEHGPFTEEQAMGMVASRVQRDEDLKK